MNHILEEDLIAYQLREAPDPELIRKHLAVCASCAETADSIAETLRVFSAEPVPQVNVDHAWQRLRGQMPPLSSPAPRRTHRWKWVAVPFFAAALLSVFVATQHHPAKQDTTAQEDAGTTTRQLRDPALAGHLDKAERLLTEVSHASGPLDESTHHQAQGLLLSNAVYVRKADASGNLAEAAVLDRLDRTLTTLQHDNGWHFRFTVDANGLLLDIRILQQNNSNSKEAQ